mgnify:CR=1 FL=1
MVYYYASLLVLSLVLSLTYAFQWHKHFPVYFTLIFAFVPIANLGYLLLSQATTLEAALNAYKITYISGCYLITFITLCIFSLCNVKLNNKLVALLILVSTLTYACALSIGELPLFYKSVTFSRRDGINSITKEYGPLHILFYILVIVYFIIGMCTMIYAYIKKRDVSRKTILLLFIPESFCFFSFFAGRTITPEIELIPFAYVVTQFIYLIIIKRICVYDITETGIDSLVKAEESGFVSFDFKYNYLGSNKTAKQIFPVLEEIHVDTSAYDNPLLKETVVKWLDTFKADQSKDKFHFEKDDLIYLVDVNFLYDGPHKRGYQLFLTDDTQDQKYIALLGHYNETLQKEVDQKTAHIVEMHNNLVLSMATMVESRDNSTGGHIKRTSDTIRILIDEMRKDSSLNLSEKFYDNLIKAAPMHDLGKIAVDDAILRKPGKFEKDEFEIMKSHAKEGARIVHEILKGTDDLEFHLMAENVAHYHHERWDGSGYPEGLKGEEIPIEARIMAIADVYDALVSKRCYKEKMSFSEANDIIIKGMGTQFDKRLEPYYISARPKLEAYYESLDSESDVIHDMHLKTII